MSVGTARRTRLCPPYDLTASLRAQRSRQSISQPCRLVRWIASSQVLLATTLWELRSKFQTANTLRLDARLPSRGTILPEVCISLSLKNEGAGNAGCALHPRSRVQNR